MDRAHHPGSLRRVSSRRPGPRAASADSREASSRFSGCPLRWQAYQVGSSELHVRKGLHGRQHLCQDLNREQNAEHVLQVGEGLPRTWGATMFCFVFPADALSCRLISVTALGGWDAEGRGTGAEEQKGAASERQKIRGILPKLKSSGEDDAWEDGFSEPQIRGRRADPAGLRGKGSHRRSVFLAHRDITVCPQTKNPVSKGVGLRRILDVNGWNS